jgi:hypothetical protein
VDWLRAALETEGDHFEQGLLSVVLRLVFLLYSEDQGLLPVEHSVYAEHLSVFGLYERLAHDAGSFPESMHHRFGAYGRLVSLFRGVFLGVRHGTLVLPPRRGRLFDPSEYPFLEGGLPGSTAAISQAEARAEVRIPSVDDGTLYEVLARLVVFEGQRFELPHARRRADRLHLRVAHGLPRAPRDEPRRAHRQARHVGRDVGAPRDEPDRPQAFPQGDVRPEPRAHRGARSGGASQGPEGG